MIHSHVSYLCLSGWAWWACAFFYLYSIYLSKWNYETKKYVLLFLFALCVFRTLRVITVILVNVTTLVWSAVKFQQQTVAWRWRRPSVGLFPYWRTYVSPYMVNFAGKRHVTKRFPGTPSYTARQKCCALPFTPQCVCMCVCKWRGLSISGLFELREFPHSAFNFPKQVVRTLAQEKW